MHIELTRKDILIVFFTLVAAFIVVPLILFGIAHGRQWQEKKTIEKIAQELSDQYAADMVVVSEMAQEAAKNIDTTSMRYHSQETAGQSLAFRKAVEALETLCENLEKNIFNGPWTLGSYDPACQVGFEKDVSYVVFEISRFGASNSDEYIHQLRELAASAKPLPMNMHFHPITRDWHVMMRTQKEPFLFFDMELSARQER